MGYTFLECSDLDYLETQVNLKKGLRARSELQTKVHTLQFTLEPSL